MPRADAARNRERILAAAEEVFAEQGANASTEEVARRAGVAIGTVFRHFPAKADLLTAILKNLLEELEAEAGYLACRDENHATGLFTFFRSVLEQAAAKRTVVEALDVRIDLGEVFTDFRDQVELLLHRAQAVDAVRLEIEVDEVLALMAALSQAALDADLRERTTEIVFAGLSARGR
ncbi:TetR/AcrR family transcriptional regulator [Amycolatopsis sp. YIM 10]|uniref:TetR/AcrR family transcriptional regulator n=1 Tax=Amycolatopsis sp. YIM 10 TaxID=2653857 RepID=UPI00129031D7|nr:TetR/AcrR family transcriptional regulator [Amycolatopsis sp. YIM 10]QFU93713.1 putative HTH-type transcriptional regulator TtgW [Amycolatopsis sp. YIM 10]